MPSVMRKINVISRCGTIFRTDKLKELGLGDNRSSFILALCRNPGMSQDTLSRRLFVNKSNVTRTLAALEDLGYVRREQSSEDKRVTLVYPTDKALDTLPKIRAVLKEWREYVTADLTEEELALLETSIEKLAKRAAEYAEMSDEALAETEEKASAADSGKDGGKNPV